MAWREVWIGPRSTPYQILIPSGWDLICLVSYLLWFGDESWENPISAPNPWIRLKAMHCFLNSWIQTLVMTNSNPIHQFYINPFSSFQKKIKEMFGPNPKSKKFESYLLPSPNLLQRNLCHPWPSKQPRKWIIGGRPLICLERNKCSLGRSSSFLSRTGHMPHCASEYHCRHVMAQCDTVDIDWHERVHKYGPMPYHIRYGMIQSGTLILDNGRVMVCYN